MNLGRPSLAAPVAFLLLFLIGAAGLSAQDAQEEIRQRDVVAALQPAADAVPLLPGQADLISMAADRSPTPAFPVARQAGSRGSVPLMAAGATLLVAGAIIGGDAGTLVMVGGAGVLAWGVYLHF